MRDFLIEGEDRKRLRSYETDNGVMVNYNAEMSGKVSLIFCRDKVTVKGVASAIMEFTFYWQRTFANRLNGYMIDYNSKDKFVICENIGQRDKYSIPMQPQDLVL